jgi:salicylate hydroxylase
MTQIDQHKKIFKPINIIGGGISGLTTALALQTNGMEYNLFEQHAIITYDNVGLGISSNIFPILQEWNILEETKLLGTEIKHFHFVDKQLKYINSFKLKTPALSIRRRPFYELLYTHLDKQYIHLNSKKSVADFSADEIVLSADGIHSATRKHIYPNLPLRDSNQILFRGISEIELNDTFKHAYHDFVGDNLRFAIIHTGQNFYSWYIIKEKFDNEIVSLDKAVLKSYFKGYHSVIEQVINQSENVYSSELLDIQPKKRKALEWFEKNTLLIGDAIHPTTPNMANGACLAIEDSYLLASLIGKNDLTLLETYKIFQKRRTKKIDPIVLQSWWLGKLFHQKNKIVNQLVKIGMRLTPNFMFDKIYSKVLIQTKIKKNISRTTNR